MALIVILLTSSPAAAAAAEAKVEGPTEDAVTGDLFEDEFGALELFEGIRRLRPRFRLSQDMVVQQPYRGGADVDSFELGFRASVSAPVTKSLALRLTGRMEATLFDFHGSRNFLDTGQSGDPFDELLSNTFVLEGRYSLGEDWAAVGGVSYSTGWERGSEYARGINVHGLFGFAHIFRDTVSVIAGVRVGGRPTGKVRYSPVFRIGWRVTDDIEIETQELGLKVAFRAHKSLTLFLSGRRASSRYRLEDRGGTVGKARLRDRRVPILVGATWKITKRWRLRGTVGAIAYQKYVVKDRDGDTVDKAVSTGPAFTGRAHVEYRF